MNISHDENGAVDVDELMEIHHSKMKRRMDADGKYVDDTKNIKKAESTCDTGPNRPHTVDSQECVGVHNKRTNSEWTIVRTAHKNTRGQSRRPKYAEVVAE
jgi:hypothetical protein